MAGLIVGIPFLVLALALLAMFRDERRHQPGERRSRRWWLLARGVAVTLLAFLAYMVASIVVSAVNGPAPGLGA